MSDIVIVQSGEKAHMDPSQSGFAHGFGLFETLKLVSGRLCFWAEHWQRLLHSAKILGLGLTVTEDAVLSAIRELVRSDGFRDGTIKLSLVRNGDDTTCYVYARPSLIVASTARLKLNQHAPLNESSLLAGHKTHNYMENVLLLESALAAGFSDVIRLNTAGHLTETAVGNLFFIQGERLHTPALVTGILPGVIRAIVIRTAQSMSLPVEEGNYIPELLDSINAAIVTNSLMGIQPVDTVVTADYERKMSSAANPIVQDLKDALRLLETEGAIDVG
jgi:branched-subunit amino acid aminotransferase/4-amino-4-deoxychorismate lyase